MSWEKTLSENKDRTHHVLNVLPIGAHSLWAGSANSAGFVNPAHIFVRMKAIEISEFLHDSKTVDYLTYDNELHAAAGTKEIRTNTGFCHIEAPWLRGSKNYVNCES